jgi:UDP-N-acetylglucosamine diphosphorylase/glucosamine-1-phosphate N-acetyltransferase
MQTVLYEDAAHELFGPLTLFRPEFELRCGVLLLREKLEMRMPGSLVALLTCRELAAVVDAEHPGRGVDALREEPTLFLSGRVIVDDTLVSAIRDVTGDAVLTSGGTPVGAVVQGEISRRAGALRNSGCDVGALGVENSFEVPARVATYPWDLVNLSAEEIEADAALLSRFGEIGATAHPSAQLVEPARIAAGEGSRIDAGVVVDATEGPVVIGRDVRIMPNAVVMGPVSVGDRSTIKAGARVYGGTSIGEGCKIGGEVEGSVFQGWSNKQHDGYLGHSYVGSWVNLGAATDNSDLKNNYSPVRVVIGGRTVDTGSIFVGATIGDHTKTAIGTKLNTGTVIGAFASVLANGFPPKWIPSFSWGTPDGFFEYDLERALETARSVMARRGFELSSAMVSLIEDVFETSRPDRKGKPPAEAGDGGPGGG